MIGGCKSGVKYTFENPNKGDEIEHILRQIIVEKLLQLHEYQPMEVLEDHNE